MTIQLRNELLNHIIDYVNDCDNDQDFSELHNDCFNQDYYIIGYYQASQWLKKHELDAFEAIQYVINYENYQFGEVNTKINSESIVNMYSYIKGEELLSNLDINLDNCTKAELLNALNTLLND